MDDDDEKTKFSMKKIQSSEDVGVEQENGEDPVYNQKVSDEYQKFMDGMEKGLSGERGDDSVFSKQLLDHLIRGLFEEDQRGLDKVFGKSFTDYDERMKEDGGDMGEPAENLLQEVWEQVLLEEPLKKIKERYEQKFEVQHFNDRKESEQYEIIKKMIKLLEIEPQNQTEIISLIKQIQKEKVPEKVSKLADFFER